MGPSVPVGTVQSTCKWLLILSYALVVSCRASKGRINIWCRFFRPFFPLSLNFFFDKESGVGGTLADKSVRLYCVCMPGSTVTTRLVVTCLEYRSLFAIKDNIERCLFMLTASRLCLFFFLYTIQHNAGGERGMAVVVNLPMFGMLLFFTSCLPFEYVASFWGRGEQLL